MDMASYYNRVSQLLHPQEEETARVRQKTNAYLTNPFLRRDGSLANKYLNYQAIANDSRTSDKVKQYIAEATGITPTVQRATAANMQSGNVYIGGGAATGGSFSGVSQNGASAVQRDEGNALTDTAKRYLGTKYVWGGTTPDGFDCSGLVQYAYAQNGISIPRTSQQQFKSGAAVENGNLRPGDLVFFKGSDGTAAEPGHVGMYVGGGQYIQAPKTGDVVKISNLNDRRDYVGARRYY